ncbi:di/tricarboxylate transporter [Spinactinospora alkalitolerans]|uniref:Di/tricarboxylate transporter n=1 Tax=Spinactinospora alkalitolerans TaxID=687207 RepID=A0A852TZM1_9ACTN|nr:SLC13 family permease [Spinactinospora alkalitolerans]NYE47414.1 di/tricarboxylate transporter [Spinactinospora alkalitolerans]
MSVEIISILVLVVVFLIATLTSAHMGALALVAAFVVGTAVVGETPDEIFGGFPGDLFVILAGVTYLFALAKNNGTVDWLVHVSVSAVRGRIALIPWVMFLVTALITAVGAVVPAAVAIIAPVGMGFAVRYRINPVLMGLMIINGASAGGFSPMSIFGGITNGVVARNGLEGSPGLLFAGSFVFNVLLSLVVFFLFGGRSLIGRRGNGGAASDDPPAAAGRPKTPASSRADRLDAQSGGAFVARPEPGTAVATAPDPAEPVETGGSAITLTPERGLTVLGIIVLAVGALAFGLDVGLMAITVAVALTLLSPKSSKGAVNQIAWPTVLLICGIVTYVSLMERMGTVDYLGDRVAAIGVPLLAAVLICLIGGAVSAFASTTGILGALIPLAVPFLLGGEVGAIGMITALAISSSVVDSSPFSTSGALVVANAPEEDRNRAFRHLMGWGMSMIVVAPLVTWSVLVVPGWL